MGLFKNTVISASAGSGKTFRLTLRYIKLLHLGVAPERIIALTFTKKAAGEIFNKIIERLLIWFSDESIMDKDCRVDGIEGMTKEKVVELLRKIIVSQHRLSIATLDSFFFKILQSFPYEYGLNSKLEIIDEDSFYLILDKTLRELFLQKLSDDEKKTLFEAFKQATFGKEEVKVYKIIQDLIESYYGSFKYLPDSNAWGNANIISEELKKEYKVDILKARAMFENKDIETKVFFQFKDAILNANDFNKESFPNDSVDTLFERIASCDGGFLSIITAKKENKPALVKFGRNYYEFEADVIYSAAMKYLSCILAGRFEKTRGIYNALKLYNNKYINNIKNQGKLVFNDIISFLQGRILTSATAQEPNQLYIDYRLDSRYDHWLIDEFQDTSSTQWNVISNLIDEVMNADAQKRSFFYVGDVKQAIYSWRGGDSYLFDEVKNKYDSRFEEEKLVRSYRSSKAIIETVNQVFDNLDRLEDINSNVVKLWKKNWNTHETIKTDNGYCAVLGTDKKKCSEEHNSELPLADIVRIINDVNPIERGLSIGILVLRNKDSDEIEKHLTENSIPCSKEGNFSLISSPPVRLLLALLKITHHPDDTIALGMIELSPLLELLPHNGNKLRMNDTIKLLIGDLHESGFAGFTSKWANIIQEKVLENNSTIHKNRLDQTVYAAELYKSEEPGTLAFIKYIEQYKIPVKTEDKCVQIITVYKAKGLEYDMVILPKLSVGKTITKSQISEGIQLMADENNRTDAAILLPPRDYAVADPILAERISRLDVKYCYEQLCVLYVALTRAKNALYIFSEPDSKSSKALHLSTVINKLLISDSTTSLPALYETGNQNWFAEKNSSENSNKTKIKPKLLSFTKPKTKQTTIPSESKKFDKGDFLSDSDNQALNLGKCIHDIFEQIQWTNNSTPEQILNSISINNYYDSELFESSKLKVMEALKKTEIKNILSKASANTELWREKEFSILIGNEWVKGRFDRVSNRKKKIQTAKLSVAR